MQEQVLLISTHFPSQAESLTDLEHFRFLLSYFGGNKRVAAVRVGGVKATSMDMATVTQLKDSCTEIKYM